MALAVLGQALGMGARLLIRAPSGWARWDGCGRLGATARKAWGLRGFEWSTKRLGALGRLRAAGRDGAQGLSLSRCVAGFQA